MAASEKLTTSETFAALTFRAAHVLGLVNRGCIQVEKTGDVQSYVCSNHPEILYHQGKFKPLYVWKYGKR